MRVIIAGSRGLGRKAVDAAMTARPANIIPTLIVSGAARGVDRAGEEWAREQRGRSCCGVGRDLKRHGAHD